MLVLALSTPHLQGPVARLTRSWLDLNCRVPIANDNDPTRSTVLAEELTGTAGCGMDCLALYQAKVR